MVVHLLVAEAGIMCVVLAEITIIRRSCTEKYLGAKVVFTLNTKFASSAGYSRFNGNFVTCKIRRMFLK